MPIDEETKYFCSGLRCLKMDIASDGGNVYNCFKCDVALCKECADKEEEAGEEEDYLDICQDDDSVAIVLNSLTTHDILLSNEENFLDVRKVSYIGGDGNRLGMNPVIRHDSFLAYSSRPNGQKLPHSISPKIEPMERAQGRGN